MRKEQVEINGIYLAKISGRLRPVKVLAPLDDLGGWVVMNVVSGRILHFRSSRRLWRKLDEHELEELIRACHRSND